MSLDFSIVLNPSSRITALGSTQPLTEMSTTNLPGGKGQRARKVDNISSICEPTVYKMWVPRRPTTLWAYKACYRNTFTSLQAYIFLHKVQDFEAHTAYSIKWEPEVPISEGEVAGA
jgi:hypothetical protein